MASRAALAGEKAVASVQTYGVPKSAEYAHWLGSTCDVDGKLHPAKPPYRQRVSSVLLLRRSGHKQRQHVTFSLELSVSGSSQDFHALRSGITSLTKATGTCYSQSFSKHRDGVPTMSEHWARW